MNTQVTNYAFTIIEDNQVPLAGNFDTYSFTPVIAIVILSLILLAILAYALWIETHFDRVRVLSGNDKAINASYFFHPAKLLRKEADLEYSLVNVPSRS